MTPSKLKALILLIVLVFSAATLAGWTWDSSPDSADAGQLQNA